MAPRSLGREGRLLVASLCWLWLLATGSARAQTPAQTGVYPLPRRVAGLLKPFVPYGEAADIARLRVARPQWAGDSLARLLVYRRLATDFEHLHQPDSAHQYLAQAWQLARPAQLRQQPAIGVFMANSLAQYYYERGGYDSTLYYYQWAAQAFHTARLDSTLGTATAQLLLTDDSQWAAGSTLASTLANAGSASRALGDLPQALRYYERARALYQQQHDLNGIGWTQSLSGETYASQENYLRAEQSYEQALATYRQYGRQLPGKASFAFAGVLLDYYLPLLLDGQARQPPAYASALAAEATRMLQAACPPQKLRTERSNALLLTRLSLVPAQVALQAGKVPAATTWLEEAVYWLRLGSRPDAGYLPYVKVRAQLLGMQAWQQHADDPARARRLLGQAVALLGRGGRNDPLRVSRQQLARYCLAMGEPAPAVQLLQPLRRSYQRSGSRLPLSQVTGLLAKAYAQTGRYDSAYFFAGRTEGLTDTLREARQFAALAAAETRLRTREQAAQIQLLTERDAQQRRLVQLAGGGALLLGGLALATLLALRATRRLNGRLAAQTALLQTQATQLGELDAAKNQFFANVSHELRTPLTLVLGPLDTLLHTPPRPLPGVVREPLALAYRHAQRLQELVTRILDLTKLRAGHLALKPTPTPLGPLLRRIIEQFAPLAAERRVALVAPAALPPDAWTVSLDADKVEQVLNNLLINAFNHTPAGGAVTVSLAVPTAPATEYALTVRDTGPGIAVEEQARVFERFYQSPQSSAQGGTGLGLALSRELAQLLSGSLVLVSEPGQGAAFTLRFPAPRLPDALPPAESATELVLPKEPPVVPPAGGARPRVLVVEDQPDLRAYVAGLLAPAHEVLLATDGLEALEVLAQEAPVDLVVSDAMMPRLNGTQLLARLKAEPAWQGLPVLMLTARADEAHRAAALAVGVDDYLTKPFVPAELLARTQALLARQQVRRRFAALPAEAPATVAPVAISVITPGEAKPLAVPLPGASLPPVTCLPAELLAEWQARVVPEMINPAFGPAEVAGLLCVSERTLYRRLGELAGLTPAAWLRELRLDQARRLLEAGGFGSVAAVAEAVGFTTVKLFNQRYTERFGRQPRDYTE